MSKSGILDEKVRQALEDECFGALEPLGRMEGRPVPPVLYHHTDLAAMESIIERGQLWLSDVYMMNDPSEVRYALSFASPCLREMAPHRVDYRTKTIGEEYCELWERDVQSFYRPFVCSFSSTHDDIQQWRAYANNGKGCALGFDTLSLLPANQSANPTYTEQLIPVSYGPSSLADVYFRIKKAVCAPLASIPLVLLGTDQRAIDHVVQVFHYAFTAMIMASIFHKHPAYRGEREFRLIRTFFKDATIKTRESSLGAVHYDVFDWRNSATLKEVIVGPASEVGAEKRVLAALAKAGIHGVEVTRCDIPYRCSR